MKVELQYKKPKTEVCTRPGTVPVSEEMHQTLKAMKKDGVKVNQQTREFWQMMIDAWKTKRAS